MQRGLQLPQSFLQYLLSVTERAICLRELDYFLHRQDRSFTAREHVVLQQPVDLVLAGKVRSKSSEWKGFVGCRGVVGRLTLLQSMIVL